MALRSLILRYIKVTTTNAKGHKMTPDLNDLPPLSIAEETALAEWEHYTNHPLYMRGYREAMQQVCDAWENSLRTMEPTLVSYQLDPRFVMLIRQTEAAMQMLRTLREERFQPEEEENDAPVQDRSGENSIVTEPDPSTGDEPTDSATGSDAGAGPSTGTTSTPGASVDLEALIDNMPVTETPVGDSFVSAAELAAQQNAEEMKKWATIQTNDTLGQAIPIEDFQKAVGEAINPPAKTKPVSDDQIAVLFDALVGIGSFIRPEANDDQLEDFATDVMTTMLHRPAVQE